MKKKPISPKRKKKKEKENRCTTFIFIITMVFLGAAWVVFVLGWYIIEVLRESQKGDGMARVKKMCHFSSMSSTLFSVNLLLCFRLNSNNNNHGMLCVLVKVEMCQCENMDRLLAFVCFSMALCVLWMCVYFNIIQDINIWHRYMIHLYLHTLAHTHNRICHIHFVSSCFFSSHSSFCRVPSYHKILMPIFGVSW